MSQAHISLTDIQMFYLGTEISAKMDQKVPFQLQFQSSRIKLPFYHGELFTPDPFLSKVLQDTPINFGHTQRTS